MVVMGVATTRFMWLDDQSEPCFISADSKIFEIELSFESALIRISRHIDIQTI